MLAVLPLGVWSAKGKDKTVMALRTYHESFANCVRISISSFDTIEDYARTLSRNLLVTLGACLFGLYHRRPGKSARVCNDNAPLVEERFLFLGESGTPENAA